MCSPVLLKTITFMQLVICIYITSLAITDIQGFDLHKSMQGSYLNFTGI